MTDNSLLSSVLIAQDTASNPDSSVWVSASAGAGKTTVLVRRVLRLLLRDDIAPENILAITYTKAAASEMSNRISSDLTEWAVCSDDDLNERLYKALGVQPTREDFAKARGLFASVLDARGGLKIQTIHSFCQSLLGRFPFEAGVPKGFKILEDTKAIMQSAQSILVADDTMLPHLEIRGLIKGGMDFDKDLNAIANDREKFRNLFSVHGGVDNAVAYLYDGLNIDMSLTEDSILQRYVDTIKGTEISLNLEIHMANLEHIINTKTSHKTAKNRLKLLKQWVVNGNIDDFNQTMFTEKTKALSAVGTFKQDNEILLQPVQDAYTLYIESINTLKLAIETSAMYYIADRFLGIYDDLKKQKNVLDFGDIIIATDKLLKNENMAPWVLHKTDKGHAHILLDESQDTAPEQWDIMRNLLEPFFDGSSDEHHTVFAVGDEKQSIYSFQGADPRGFTDAKGEFEQKALSADLDFKDVPVHVSFRSTSAVLDMVDSTLSESFGGVKHEAMRVGQSGEVHLHPVLINKGKHLDNIKASAILADEMAERIRHLIGSELASKNHTITAGDIMVLVRSRTAFVDALISALKNRDIPVAGADRMQLMEQIAVEDLISLLQFMIMPLDDLNLACLLKSPLVGMDDDTIFSFANGRGKKSLWQALRMYGESTAQHSTVINYLNDWLNKADFARPFEILNMVLNSVCPLGSVLNTRLMTGWCAFRARLGVQAQEPITELLNVAMKFEQENVATLQSFISYLNTVDGEIKRDSEKGVQDEVKIMTIHGAKGLESPIVIMPDCFKTPRNPNGFMWDEHLKYCLWFSTTSKTYGNGDFSPSGISKDIKKRNWEESLRLLYVGMTRAEDILICAGQGSRDEKKTCEQNTWYDYLKLGMENLGVEKQNYVPYSNNYKHIWEDETQLSKVIGASYYVYKTEQTVEKKGVKITTDTKNVVDVIPDWALKNAVTESPIARPLAPSRIMEMDMPPAPSPLAKDSDGIDVFKRGNVMHRALEILPQVPVQNRQESLKAYLASPALSLSPEIQVEWALEISRVLDTHAHLFDENSRAEVPVTGIVTIEGTETPISGIIDRLCTSDTAVWIVDFKSNRPAPSDVADVPEGYIKQLEIYKKLLEKIYPDKTIHTVLLWTYSCKIMHI